MTRKPDENNDWRDSLRFWGNLLGNLLLLLSVVIVLWMMSKGCVDLALAMAR